MRTDPGLQSRLIHTYLGLIDDAETLPALICFYVNVDHLVVISGSAGLDPLKSLQAKGVHLVLYNTCLNFYALGDQVEVEAIGRMTNIIEV